MRTPSNLKLQCLGAGVARLLSSFKCARPRMEIRPSWQTPSELIWNVCTALSMMNGPERIVQSSTMCYELYEHEACTRNVQYGDCMLVSFQHDSTRLHRRDTEVPILQCWPDRLRRNLPLQKTVSILRRATQTARLRGSRIN